MPRPEGAARRSSGCRPRSRAARYARVMDRSGTRIVVTAVARLAAAGADARAIAAALRLTHEALAPGAAALGRDARTPIDLLAAAPEVVTAVGIPPPAVALPGDPPLAVVLAVALPTWRTASGGPWIAGRAGPDGAVLLLCARAAVAEARGVPVLAEIAGASAGRPGDPERDAPAGTPARLRATARAARLALADGRLRATDVVALLADGPAPADPDAPAALARVALGPPGETVATTLAARGGPAPGVRGDDPLAAALTACTERRVPPGSVILVVHAGASDAAVALRVPAGS